MLFTIQTHAHTHTRLTALCQGLPGWASTRKVKPIRILLKQETVSGSGIRWATCKSAPRSRQITMPAAHHSVFLQPDALPAAPNQQCQSTEGNSSSYNINQTIKVAYTERHGVYYLQRSTHCCRLPFQHPAPTDRLLQSASNPHNITTTFIHSQKYSCYDHLYNLAM